MSEIQQQGMYAIALGTAGGPKWWGKENVDAGISTAIVIDGSVYLVDFGSGAGRQLRNAGFTFTDVEALFVTHMHSDHTVDLASLLLIGHHEVKDEKLTILGPGPRGKLPPLTERASSTPSLVCPDDPVPGIEKTFERLVATYSTDINDRMFDYGTASPASKFHVHDIEIPVGVPFDPNENLAPTTEPFLIFQDEKVRVRAILVSHHPTAPAYAFRFDSEHGSIVVSGDTGYCENMVTIARDCDVLFHEAIALETIEQQMLQAFPDPDAYAAMMSHHRRSHTTAYDAGEVARRARVRTLVLHHLVPADAPMRAWYKATDTFDGEFVVAKDLQIIPLNASAAGDSDSP